MNREDPRYLRTVANALLYRAATLNMWACEPVECMPSEWCADVRQQWRTRAVRCARAAGRLQERAWELDGEK